MRFAESKEIWSPEAPSSVFRAPLCWRLLCLSSCFVDPHPDSGRVGRQYEDFGDWAGALYGVPAFALHERKVMQDQGAELWSSSGYLRELDGMISLGGEVKFPPRPAATDTLCTARLRAEWRNDYPTV